ncbi:flavodoxin family protein [Schleiferilactobacillus harbinensis]|uniref:NAD(P)H-dependent oxidoreductase n=1 Tax=Schleiferilactobacillus harbinensis TaxID=304207 RepID=UPI0021A6922C|nr:NAD(P)H-dependent oxidoreductase [Schleiferilactobacillus harbinensis]MCT2907657.1 flavodoxin family protein [Schleiferilactobacillus harbinensis]
MTQFLIIYTHPYDRSFNHAELDRVTAKLTEQGDPYQVIDLYHDGFNPAYDAEELRLFHSGQTHDPLVTQYLTQLKAADAVIFITPIWWNDLPGMLKGFIDKVMKEGAGLTHVVTKTGVKGTLTNIQKTYVLTTSTSPTFYLRFFCGNAVKQVFIGATLKQLGMQHVRWSNFGGITNAPEEKRKAYLEKVGQMAF